MFTGRKLFVTLLTMCCLAIPSHFNRVFAVGQRPPVALVTCHDNVWDPGEYCGYDAVAATGVEDMNHDCLVDALDFCLLNVEYGTTGPALSGDCKSSGAPGPPILCTLPGANAGSGLRV